MLTYAKGRSLPQKRRKTTAIYNYNNVPASLAHPKRTLVAQSVLYECSQEGSTLYIVNSGILKSVVPASIGRDRIADLYGAGDVIGHAAIDGSKHSESVIALQESIITPIDPEQAMLDRHLRRYIMCALTQQIRRSHEVLNDSELPVGARVTRTLSRLSKRFGQPVEGRDEYLKLPLALTHEDLACFTGSSRVTITRILGELRNMGALQGTRGVYVAHKAQLEVATDSYVLQSL